MNNRFTVGVVGVGAMGLGIAKNLLRKGFALAVRDIRPEAEAAARELCMSICPSPAAVAESASIIIVVVVNAAQIETVLFGADGIATTARAGTTVLLCSTIAPQDAAGFAQRLADDAGIDTIDAPISGGPARAEAGTMSMMLAAPAAVLERTASVLEAMADKRFYISEHNGDAAKAKLVNNLLAGINLVAGAEALGLGASIGLDPRKLFDMISASSGASWVFQDRMSRVLADDFEPRAHTHILTKDLTLATAMADDAAFETPLADAALHRFRQAIAMGLADLDDAAVIKTYQTQG